MSIQILVIGIAFLLSLALWGIFSASRRRGSDSYDQESVDSEGRRNADEDQISQALRLSVPARFVVFDLETTGLDPNRHEIIEIGAIKVNRDSEVHATFQCLVKPRKRIPKYITKINGISQEMVDHDGETLEAAVREFAEFIEDLPLVSFNAEFDMGFLRPSARRHGIRIRNSVSCALKMAREAWPGRQSYRLCDLAEDGGLPGEGAHRAIEDCKRTIFIYTGACTRLSTRRHA